VFVIVIFWIMCGIEDFVNLDYVKWTLRDIETILLIFWQWIFFGFMSLFCGSFETIINCCQLWTLV